MCVGLDTHKAKIAVAVAEPGRAGEVRFVGEIANQPDAVRRLIERLADKHGRLKACYEAGPCGYGLQRRITALGQDCTVVAPSLVPRKPGDRVKTNRRDAVTLARLHRAGELTAVWVPDPAHEAMRDLVRARTAAMEVVRRARRQLQGFLLRHDRVFMGRKAWSPAHRRWLAELRFAHPAQQVVLQEQIDAVEEAERRRDRLGQQIGELAPDWSLAPVVAALQAMRGVAFLSAVALVAEVGDFRRFANPRQLMAWLGLVPSEHSSGAKVERGGITIGLRPIPGGMSAQPTGPGMAGQGACWSRVPGATASRRGSRARSRPGWMARLRPCGRSPGRRSSGSAPASGGSWPPARTPTWSPPRSPARWRPSPGRSRARSSPSRLPPEPVIHQDHQQGERQDVRLNRIAHGWGRRPEGNPRAPLWDRSPTSRS